MASKQLTADQVAARKDKAERFVRDVLEDDDRADEIADESVESYADRKHFVITNPNKQRRKCMANIAPTKSDLQETLDQIQDILESAYTPESSREDLAAAVGDALDALAPPEDEDEDADAEDLEDENGDNGD